MQNVVVIFQATQRHTEGLALAFGLGAVQRGANIRLRHLDPSPAAELAHASYGVLRTEDLLWAQGVAIFLESSQLAGLGELTSAFEGLGADPVPAPRWAYVFHEDPNADSLRHVETMARTCGFQQLVDHEQRAATAEYMTHMGQQMAVVLEQNV
jgi:hypothetical protein